MKLQFLQKEDLPQQDKVSIQNSPKPQKEAYYVLQFPELLNDTLVVIIIDRGYVFEAKSKYPGASFWSIEALKRYMSLPGNRDPQMWKAVNLTKAIFGGKIIR